MLLQAWLRVVALMCAAALFIVQQVSHPLVTIWVAIGEYLHCVSYVLLLELICSNKGLRGLSMKTQICFLLVHWFRYLDSFFHTHPNQWIAWLKIFYMVVSALLVLSLVFLRSTWERKKDTCSLLVLLFISILFGTINFLVDGNWPSAASERTFHYFWILSHYLQGFAMLPQFVFCYRDPDNKDSLLTAYVVVLGSYRLAYAINWVERAYKERFFYVSGPLGLGILLVFLGDYLLFKYRKKSCISSFVLRIVLLRLLGGAVAVVMMLLLLHACCCGVVADDVSTSSSTLSAAALATAAGAAAAGGSRHQQQQSDSAAVSLAVSGVSSAVSAGGKRSPAVSHRTGWLDDEWHEEAAAGKDGLYRMETEEDEEEETETYAAGATVSPLFPPGALVSYSKDSSQPLGVVGVCRSKEAAADQLPNGTALAAAAASSPETETATTAATSTATSTAV